MTNLKAVNLGQNKFCGPAVLSILTGRSTDECAATISKINGAYNVTGVELIHLEKAAERLGFKTTRVHQTGLTLYSALRAIADKNGMYIVTITGHFVSIEVKDKKIYFCDNHTKEPIPAASSARLSQQVLAITRVEKNPDFKDYTPPPKRMNAPSPAFLEVLNLCNAAKHHKLHCTKECDVSLTLLKDAANRIYYRIIDVDEMKAAKERITDTEWL